MAHSHSRPPARDKAPAFTGLVVGALVIGAILFGIVKATNAHYAGEKAGVETRK